MSKLTLKNNIGRVYFKGAVGKIPQTILFDPGSPNTLITVQLVKLLGLKPGNGNVATLRIAGKTVRTVVVTLPTLSFGDLCLANVRVLAGDFGAEWEGDILLGLNVLNYLVYTVDRSSDPGTIDIRESTRKAPKGAVRTEYDNLIQRKESLFGYVNEYNIAPDTFVVDEELSLAAPQTPILNSGLTETERQVLCFAKIAGGIEREADDHHVVYPWDRVDKMAFGESVLSLVRKGYLRERRAGQFELTELGRQADVN